MTDPILMISGSADFEPRDAPEGMITWTFMMPKTVPVSAGLFELRFIRTLTRAERDARDYAPILSAKALPPNPAEDAA